MHRSVRVGRLYCCAMEEEAQPIIDHYRMLLLDKNTVKKFLNLESKMFGNYFFRMSDMIKIYMSPGKQHALVVTGIGKTNAAMVSAYAIEVLNPTDIINIGLCGSLRKDLFKIGQFVLVTHVCQHDVYIPEALRSEQFNDLYQDIEIHHSHIIRDRDLYYGLQCVKLATGDSFVDSDFVSNRIITTFGSQIVDMEGYSLGKVCKMYGKQLTMIKMISDGASENASSEFSNIFELYKKNIVSLLDLI